MRHDGGEARSWALDSLDDLQASHRRVGGPAISGTWYATAMDHASKSTGGEAAHGTDVAFSPKKRIGDPSVAILFLGEKGTIAILGEKGTITIAVPLTKHCC